MPTTLLSAKDPRAVPVVTRSLQDRGHEIVRETSASAARSRLLGGVADLAIVDLGLGADVVDLVQDVHLARPDVPIVLLTTASQRQTAARLTSLGAFAYTLKPVFPDEIGAVAGRALSWVRQAGRLDRCLVARRRLAKRIAEIQRKAEADPVAGAVTRLLATLRRHDEESAAHAERMRRSSVAIGAALGADELDPDHLGTAAELHDIGKIGVPEMILRKPAPLTREEFEVVARHPRIGAEILDAVADRPALTLARDVALRHHERWDGSGYPDGLRGEDIPLAARVVGMADVYDALVHDRVYRPAYPERVALAYVATMRGRMFDPRVHDAFLDALPEIRRIHDRAA